MFPCSKCGQCCRQIGKILAAREHVGGAAITKEVAAFPYAALPSGACEKLGADGQCTVYAERPQLCRVDVMGERMGLSREDNWQLTAWACNELQRRANISHTYRITPSMLHRQERDDEDKGKGKERQAVNELAG